MNRLRTFTLLTAILIAFAHFTAHGSSHNKNTPSAKNGYLDLSASSLENRPVSLKGQWHFYWKKFITPGEKTTEKPDNIKVPDAWIRALKGKYPARGFCSYKLVVTFPPETRTVHYYFGDISSAYRFYVNGTLIEERGKPAKTMKQTVPEIRPAHGCFNIKGNKTELLFHITNYHHRDGGLWQTPLVGKKTNISTRRSRSLAMDLFVFGALLIMGLYHLGLYFYRKEESSPLYLGLFCLIIALRTILMGERFIGEVFPEMPWLIRLRLEYLTIYAGGPVIFMFVYKLFPFDFHKIVVKIFAVLSLPFIIVTAFFPGHVFTEFMTFYHIIILLYIIYALIMLGKAIYHKRDGAIVYLLGFNVLFFSWLFDILYNQKILDLFHHHIASYGLLVFILFQAFIIAKRFSMAFHSVTTLGSELAQTNLELTELNQNLEEKVQERTMALSAAKDDIETAMEELEAMNSNLVDVNHEMEMTQRIISQDMALANTVQSKFLPEKAPVTENWDTAFFFKPMSDVSGDFYDFYMEDDELSGTALCDVSGHGVSSGLITMLARSLLFRTFTSYANESAGIIMEHFNRELIKEVGNVDNYITGILLKISETSIEYANAGHTEMIIHRPENGQFILEDPHMKGTFLGISLMEDSYSTSEIAVKKGDRIIVYSDCLIESQNPEGEQMDIERIKSSVASCSPESTAEEIINKVTEDLIAFRGSESFNDDCTVIVLVKL